jgi:16S rRNA (guanine966-N2)-methyltransferase
MTRIIAGLAKGRRLQVPADGTRPTADRAREGLFNSLAATMELDGARVLDLYAGTGAVGLEALSRGASRVVLVESDRRAAEILRRNVDAVALPGARVAAAPVARFLAAGTDGPYDLVFADPPYAAPPEEVLGVLTALCDGPWLAPGATVVVERARRGTPLVWGDERITPEREKRYGEAVFWYGRAR